MAVFRRFAKALIHSDDVRRRRRTVLEIGAQEFLSKLRVRQGRKGGQGYGGWELSNIAEPAFWATLLLSQRRQRFAMRLIDQQYPNTAAVTPYVREKQATQEILDAIPGIDAGSLIGFADVAIGQFQPAGMKGEPLVPSQAATEILKAVLLRGAMVGELRPEAARDAWLAAHPEARPDPDRHWRTAQGKAESLYQGWSKQRGRRRAFA